MTDYERFSHALSYDKKTGILRWRNPTCLRLKSGDIAGSVNNAGYWRVNFQGKTYSAHRIAWLLTFGNWPTQEIDHINRNRLDNRIANLRDVSRSENARNRRFRVPGQMRHGGRGITRLKSGKWQVQVHDPRIGRAKYFGSFSCFGAAISAARTARVGMDL